MATNVPLPTLTDAGLTVPGEADILAGVLADYVDAFALTGRALSTELTTPQGQLAQTQAYLLNKLNAALLQIINGVDPATASGAFQDALGRIYFLTRQPATYATAQATLTGVPGSVIPSGSQARSTLDGSLWSTVAPTTLGPSGTAAAVFRADVAGAAPAVGPNGLRIYRQVPGWEGVTNDAAIPGTDVESRANFEQRRAESVNIGGNGTADAVRAAMAAVVGVRDVFVYNNASDTAITYGATAYPIPAHSIAAVAVGGDDAAVAGAIHSKLDAGCGMASAVGAGDAVVTIDIKDSVNYSPPYPRYQVRFLRPAAVPVCFRVEVANIAGLPATFAATVQRAVATAFTQGFSTADGSITVRRARIGSQIVATDFIAPILVNQSIVPVRVFVGFTANPTAGSAVTLGIDQFPVCNPQDVTVEAVAV